MAIKRMQMYRRNLDGTETRLNPLTEAQYVSMENGQTVQEILSDRDSDKYTPVITNSSSTFKVGQGDNVDLSSSMKEGAYDSCVLKGKTMVNCIQEPSSKDVVLPYEFADGQYVTINDTKESGALGIELKGQTLVNLQQKGVSWNINGSEDNPNSNASYRSDEGFPLSKLKPNTKYLVKFSKDISATYGSFYFVQGTQTSWTIQSGGWGIVTTKSELTSSATGIHVYPRKSNGVTAESLQDVHVMIIEYVDGMEHWDIPYFEGMTSCKMPTLHTVGKNLFDLSNASNGYLSTNAPYVLQSPDYNNKTSAYIKVKPNTKYSYSFDGFTPSQVGNMYWTGFYYYKRIGEVSTVHPSRMTFTSNSEANKQLTFTTPSDCNYIRIGSRGLMLSGATVQLEEATSATAYEPYKSSILSLPEEVVLRSLPNGVCDTFNTRTGVYTQRIKEIVFDGSNDEGWNVYRGDWVLENSTVFYTYISGVKGYTWSKYTGKEAISDKIPSYPDNWLRLNDVLGMTNDNTGARKQFRIPKSYLETDNVDGFRKWLEQNPVTACFELATPIITKVNLSSTLKSWNTTTHIYSEIPENTLYPILSHSNPSYPVILKPSTKYSIVANSYSNNHTNSAINFNLGGATATTTVGNRVTTITTPSTLSNELLTMSGRGNKLNNVMVIEGDVVGDEPYFEGMCDCKSPILLNCGKNLFDEQRHSNPDNFFVYSSYWSIPIQLKGNTEYKFSYTFNNVLDKQVVMRFATCPWTDTAHSTHPYSLGQVFNKNITSNLMGRTESMLFTTPADGLVYLHYYNTELTNSPSSFNLASWYTYILKDIHLEESSTSTQYESYKSNTTTFNQKDNKTIVLRSLPNGVCDTLNVETGEHVQRIGEVTKNNSTGFSLSSGGWENKSDVCTFEHFKPEGMKVQLANNKPTLNCDKVPSNTFSTQWNNSKGIESITQHNWGNIVLSITRDKLLTQDVNGLNTYLQSNPLTIQYELATPIVSTIDVQGFPYAYTSGHVQLSSGHNGQSLTPKVEYSLSANKTGQIDNNTRQVVRQQNKLDDFEAMMLTAMVQSAYDKAILQFDYEMQMMSLGGE